MGPKNWTSKAVSCAAGKTLSIAVSLVACSSASVMTTVSLTAAMDRGMSSVLVCKVEW